jgi:two-component system nitrate/nitrite response regulator NarL
MDGLPTSRIVADVKASALPTRILILSAVTERDAVAGLLEAGAAGYIAKQATRDAICNAIRRVAAGESVIGHEVQTALVDELRAGRSRERIVLTAREQECLGFLAEGLSSIQIADRLILGPSTVKSHLRSLYEKLGVSDRGAAVAEGMRRGLVR